MDLTLWLTTLLFALTYAGLAWGKIPGLRMDRAGIALVGAVLMLAAGLLSFEQAVAPDSIDYKTIALLFGMMIVVGFLRLSGFFSGLTAWAIRRLRSPLTLLAATITLSGVLSAFLINDVVCVAMTPLVLHLSRRLRFDPVPHLIALATAANIGSAGTITGNPQNIYIGSHSGISYLRFAVRLLPVSLIGLGINFLVVVLVYRGRLTGESGVVAHSEVVARSPDRATELDRRYPVASGDLRSVPVARSGDRATTKPSRAHNWLQWKSATVALVTVVLFFAGLPLELVALGAAALLLLGRVRPEKVYRQIDWNLLIMFTGLFIVVHAFQRHVVSCWGIERWDWLLGRPVDLLSLVSAGMSNLVSNVPAVLLMEPMVQAISPESRETAWLALAMSSTFAGNLTVLGSVANLIVVEQARREGVAISFGEYCKVGIPLTILTLALGIAWLGFVPIYGIIDPVAPMDCEDSLMLLIGEQRQRTCHGCTRRAFLQVGGSTVLGLSLSDLLRLRAEGGVAGTGTAKSVLLLWLWGGPAHLDTWDPKPSAPIEYRGPFTPIATKVNGVRITELFPQIAEVANEFSIIRSLSTGSNDHGVAGTIGLTGSGAGAINLGGATAAGGTRPATGSVVARVRGFKSKLPPFLVIGGRLHQGKKAIAGEGGGPLGALYDPFRLEYDPVHGTKVPALQLEPGLTPERLSDRHHLMTALDAAERHVGRPNAGAALDDYRAQAFALLTSAAARKMFDLGSEPERMKERYGLTRFGQSCLLARRLVESGVPFVQVNWSDHVEAEEDAGDGGWDHHYRNFQIMQDRHAPWLDQAYSALLSDLKERGLLKTTLVVAVGEFGRSPKINDKAGRDHWEHCYSALVAGGGVRGGRIIGASDARGDRPRERPVTPADVAATIHRCVGITSEQAQTLGIAVEGKVIEELI